MAEYRVNENEEENKTEENNDVSNNTLLKDSPDFIKGKTELHEKLAELLAILERKRHDFNMNVNGALKGAVDEKSSGNNKKEIDDDKSNAEEVSITTNPISPEP